MHTSKFDPRAIRVPYSAGLDYRPPILTYVAWFWRLNSIAALQEIIIYKRPETLDSDV